MGIVVEARAQTSGAGPDLSVHVKFKAPPATDEFGEDIEGEYSPIDVEPLTVTEAIRELISLPRESFSTETTDEEQEDGNDSKTTTIGIRVQKEIDLAEVASLILTGMPRTLGGFEIETYKGI